jgi:GTP-binding protein
VSSPSPLARLAVEFVGSFPDPLHPLDPPLPEFAFIGRSNVGKSSLLNALTAKKTLAKVSQTPGKTQLVNVFRFPSFYMVDLPGYGWARASKGERSAYRTLLERFVRERQSLSGIVWLLDIRHTPSRDDIEFQELLSSSGRPVLPVLTKMDKLNRSGRAQAIRDRSRELGLPLDLLQPVSAQTGEGIGDLGEAILAAASEAEVPG